MRMSSFSHGVLSQQEKGNPEVSTRSAIKLDKSDLVGFWRKVEVSGTLD